MTKHKHTSGLGFRSLRDFNLAILGKQCWHLITNQDSLVAHVYKAKYYADKSFLKASLGNSPSFIWRSVLEARKLICATSSWSIGNGNDITILNQPWLNDNLNPYISTVSPSLVDQKVSALFRIGTKEWDLDILKDIFEERDQNCIVNTIVEPCLNTDVMCWNLENSGQYSVRSAYRFLQEQKGACRDDDDKSFWKAI